MAEQDMMAPMPPEAMPPEMQGAMPPQAMPPEAMPPEMQGALPPQAMPPELAPESIATEAMMAPDPDVTAIVATRLSAMAPEDLELLDAAITPDVAKALVKLLPELQSIIDMIGDEGMPADEMGALGGIV